MATPTQPHRSLLKHRILRLLVMACACLLAATIAPTTALADPPVLPDTASEAAQQVSELQHELEVLSEQRNDAQVALDQHVAEVGAAAASLEQANARLVDLDGAVRGVARNAYAGQRLGSFSAMLTSGSPQEFLDRVNTLEFISAHDGALLAEATQAHSDAEAMKAAADSAVASAEAAVADIAALKAELESQIDTYRELFAQLSAAEQAAVSGATPGAEAGNTTDNTTGNTTDNTTGQAPPGPILAPTEAARIAVESAYAQLGDSYVYGAGGPDAFDCSGLTSYVYRQAGVSLPHSSRSQSTMGVPVSRDELQPGDLVFYYSPVSHVAIYVGDGQIIHASNESRPVELAPVDVWGAYNSARRIVG